MLSVFMFLMLGLRIQQESIDIVGISVFKDLFINFNKANRVYYVVTSMLCNRI